MRKGNLFACAAALTVGVAQGQPLTSGLQAGAISSAAPPSSPSFISNPTVIGLPATPVVVGSTPGSATTFSYNTTGTRLDVNSNARRVVIDWDNFSIDPGKEVIFTLPDGRSIAVNRIACFSTCYSPSLINGTLRSNGNVWILNPAGVFFGGTARVDVAGLLATPAALDDLQGFIAGTANTYTGFTMPSFSGGIRVDPGAELVSRGGPIMLVGGSAYSSSVYVAGVVKSADGASQGEKDSSQILYGAAGKFRLLMHERAPSAIGSGDLDLFDFVIDEGFSSVEGSVQYSPPAIELAEGSVTRAGQVIIAAKAEMPLPTPGDFGAGGIAIKSSIEATATDRNTPLGAALQITGDGVDVALLRTTATPQFNSPNAAAGGGTTPTNPTLATALNPQVTLSSAGSIAIRGRRITAPQVTQLLVTSTEFQPIEDHVTVELAGTGAKSLIAKEKITLVGAKLGGAALSAGNDVSLYSSLVDVNAGNISADGSIMLGETSDANRTLRVPTAAMTVGNLSAGGSINVFYRNAFNAGGLVALGDIVIRADKGVSLGSAQGSRVELVASDGSVLVGSTSPTGNGSTGNGGSTGGTTTGGNSSGQIRSTAANISINAKNAIRTGNLSSAGRIDLGSGSGSVQTGSLAGTLSIQVSGGNGVQLGNVETDKYVSIFAEAGGVLTGTVRSNQERVQIFAPGNVNVGDITAGQQIELRSFNDQVVAGVLSAGQQVDVRAEGNAIARAVSASSVGMSSRTGVVAVGTGGPSAFVGGNVVASRGPVNLDSATVVKVGNVDGDQGVAITARGGDIDAGSVVANNGAVTLTANNNLRSGNVRGTAVNLQATNGSLVSGFINATSGNADLNAKSNITANDVVASGATVLESANGNISVARLNGTSVLVTALAGAATTGAITSTTSTARVTANGAVQTGTIDAQGTVELESKTGSVSTGSVIAKTNSATLWGATGVTAGDVSGPSIRASSSNGTVTTGALTASSGDIQVTAKGALQTGTVTAAKLVNLESTTGGVKTGTLTAGDEMRVTAATGAAVTSVRATSVELSSSNGSVRVGSGDGAQFVAGSVTSTSGSTTVNARDSIVTGDIDAATAINVKSSAGAITTGKLRARDGGIDIDAANDAAVSDIESSREVRVRAANGAITAASIKSTGTTELVGKSGIVASGINAAGLQATASGGSVTLGAITTTVGDIKVLASGAVQTASVTSAKAVDLESTAASVKTGALTVGTALRAVGATGVTLPSVRATSVELSSSNGSVRVGSGDGAQFVAGSVTSTSGSTTVNARDSIVTGDIDAATAINVKSSAGAITTGKLRARDGGIDIDAANDATVGEAEASRDVKLRAATGTLRAAAIKGAVVTLAAGNDVLMNAVDAQSLKVNATRNITVSGAVNSAGNAAFSAGGTFANTGAIRVTNGTAITNATPVTGYGGVDIRAADVEIGALISVRGNGAGIQLQATGSGGVALGENTGTAASAMKISNAELQQLDASTVAVRAAETASSGANIVVGDLTLDRAKISQLTLATGSTGKLTVAGAVRGTGAPTLVLGEAGMKPGDIDISGSLGSVAAPMGQLQLRSAGNIFIGSSAFIEQVRAASDIVNFDLASIPQNAGGTASGQLFIVSGATSLEATRGIIQQNTGGRAGYGIRVGLPSGSTSSLIVPGVNGAPARVALFGSIIGADGNPLTGVAAARAAGVLPAGTAENPVWRINTCIAGSGDACAAANNPLTTIIASTTTVVTPPVPPAPPVSTSSTNSGGASSGGSSSGGSSSGESGSSGSGDSGSGGEAANDEEQEPTEEERAAEEAAAEVATAATESTENDIKPIEVDPGSRDLLNPASLRDVREAGVGSANEDLWPETVP